MKRLVRNCFVLFFAVWVLYMGIQILDSKTITHEIDWWVWKGILGAFFSVCVSFGSLFLNAYPIFPRTKYLESSNNAKPVFRIAYSSVIDIPQGFDFSHLKSEIASKWLITFSDDINHVLKFRSKMNFFTNVWGAAAWLKFDGDTRKIRIECFPLAGIRDNDLARKMKKEIENCVQFYKPS